MKRQERMKQAEAKRELARRMLLQGKTGPEIHLAVKKKYRSGIGDGVLVKLRRELNIAHRLAKPRVKQVDPEEVILLPPVETALAMVENPPDLEIQTRLAGVLNWMGVEGIHRIHLDLEAREVRLERTEVIHC